MFEDLICTNQVCSFWSLIVFEWFVNSWDKGISGKSLGEILGRFSSGYWGFQYSDWFVILEGSRIVVFRDWLIIHGKDACAGLHVKVS